MIRVLCFSPYNFWQLHAKWELTILQGLRLRGAEVKLVHCDGQFTDCDVFWASTNRRDSLTCSKCQAAVASTSSSMGMSYEWLGRYVLLEERSAARDWANSLEPSEFLAAQFDDWQVGFWVESSVHSHFRLSQLDFENPEIIKTYRSYLYSGLVACFGLNRLLDAERPDTFFLFNGRMSNTRVAFELARRKGIRVVCHERGLLNESMVFFENMHCLDLRALKDVARKWEHIPLTSVEVEKLHDYLLGREHGKNLSWWQFSPPPQNHAEVREALGLNTGRRLWALFTSSDDEVLSEGAWRGPFDVQLDWVVRTISFAAEHPSLDLVIRVHPNTAGKKALGANLKQLREFQELKTRLPANVRIVLPEDPVSSYSLMDMADAGLVFQSTVGLEMACKGKLMVAAAGSLVSDLSFVRTVKTQDAYDAMLEELLADPGGISLDIQRNAYRFGYAYFFRWNLPFPLVRMPDPYSGVLTYDSLSDLDPGMDAGLDRAVGIVLDGDPPCPDPDSSHLSRDDGDERAFFGSQAAVRSALEASEGQPPVSLLIATGTDLAEFQTLISRLIETTPDHLIEAIIVDNSGSEEFKAYLSSFEGDVQVIPASSALDEEAAWKLARSKAGARRVIEVPVGFHPERGWLEAWLRDSITESQLQVVRS